MKIEERKTSLESHILTGMIVDPIVLGRISSKWKRGGLFGNKWSNLIGRWCVDFFDKHGKAPGKSIVPIFNGWAEKAKDENTVELVELHLSTLSDRYKAAAKEINPDYVLDIAAKHFDKIASNKLAEEVQQLNEAGETEEAIKRIHEFEQVKMGQGVDIDVMQDMEAIRDAFQYEQESLIEYPKPLNQFFMNQLARDCFVVVQGVAKRGKSWHLLDFVVRGAQQRRKVGYIVCGDMSQRQVIKRLCTRWAGRPLRACTVKYPTKIRIRANQSEARVWYEEREFTRRLDWREAWKGVQRAAKRAKTDEPLIKLACYPAGSITIKDVYTIIRQWDREGWGIPDIIVLDYIDILAKLRADDDIREATNQTWIYARGLSSSIHCCLITATQAKASAYEVYTMNQSHFSEDSRKNAHVTAMMGLNQTQSEKKKGVMRLNWIEVREEEFHVRRFMHVAECLAIANPFVRGCWKQKEEE